MFFILSKILLFLINPVCWVLILLLLSVFIKSSSYKKYSLVTALVLLFFISCNPITNWVLEKYEYQTILANDIEDSYDIGILLTGSSKRLFKPLELYRAGKIEKILVVGSEEANDYGATLIRLGIPKNDLLINDASLNTYKSALNCKPLLEAIQKEHSKELKFLLITSALHMRRSRLCFLKQGIVFDPLSVDYKVPPNAKYKGDYPITLKILNLIPSALSMYHWKLMIKEWVGIAIYKLSDYI